MCSETLFTVEKISPPSGLNSIKVNGYTCRGFGWLVVLGLTALLDNISVYIGPSPKEREKEEKG